MLLRIIVCAERVGRAAELLMPQRVGQHRHARRVRPIVVGRHQPADLRLHAEHLEEIRRRRYGVNPLRVAAAGQRRGEVVERGEAPWRSRAGR